MMRAIAILLRSIAHWSTGPASAWPAAPVVNTTLNPGTARDLTSGQHYQLVDARNWPMKAVGGASTSGTNNLPNLTNVSTLNGPLTHDINDHTNARVPGLFNTFVLACPLGPTINIDIFWIYQ